MVFPGGQARAPDLGMAYHPFDLHGRECADALGPASGEEFIKDGAQGIDIRSRGDRESVDLFGACVFRGEGADAKGGGRQVGA